MIADVKCNFMYCSSWMRINIIKEPGFSKLLLLPVRVLSAPLPPCFDPRLFNARTCSIYSLSMPASPFPQRHPRQKLVFRESGPRQCPSSSTPIQTYLSTSGELLPLQSFCSTRHSLVCPRMGLLLSRGLRMILSYLSPCIKSVQPLTEVFP